MTGLCIHLPPPPTGTPPSRRRRIEDRTDYYLVQNSVKRSDQRAASNILRATAPVTFSFSPYLAPRSLNRRSISKTASSPIFSSCRRVVKPNERKNSSVRSIASSMRSSFVPEVIPHTLSPYCPNCSSMTRWCSVYQIPQSDVQPH